MGQIGYNGKAKPHHIILRSVLVKSLLLSKTKSCCPF